MSQIILNWLNEQIQLSRRITNFEQDFNNGYLLGELLKKYNQQLNFNDFLDKDDKKSKLKNFELLFDTFASLKVTFNSSIANQIINKKSGIAKKLLYELKMNLQKTNSNAFTKLTKITKTLSPLKKIKVSKQQYDKVDKQHFLKQLNELHPAQKTLNQQKLLKRFSDFHQKQISVNNQLAEKDFESKNLQQKKFRQRQRDNLKKTADFRNEWERSNGQKWQANMTVRHIQQEKDMVFKTRLQQTKVQNKTMSQLSAIKLLDKDINQFERKFIKGNKKKNLIQDSDDSGDQEGNMTISQQPQLTKKQSKLSQKLKFTSSGNPQMSFDSPSKKKKLSSHVPEQQKHQREKKRRKMIVQQNKRYQLIQISRREKYILSTIQQTSKQEKQLEYQVWRVWQNKQIIKENKTLQQDKQNQKNQVRQINAKFKRDQLLKTYRQQHEAQVAEACTRQDKLLKDNQVAQRKNTYSRCKNIISQFIQVAEKCFMTQQQTNQQEISKDLLQHLFGEFIQGTQTRQDVAKLQLHNYIHGRGDWNLLVKRKTEDQPTDPLLDNALPNKVTNNYALGNILRLLYQNKYNNIKKSDQQLKNLQKPKYEFVFCLLGLQFSGKHLAAEYFGTKHNFAVIQIEKLIIRKIQEYEQIKDKVTEVGESTKLLVNLAYNGKDIPNTLIIELIREQISKSPRSVILNFPTTYNQALQLTRALANVQPSDSIQISPLQQRIKSFSRLVWPSESRTIPKPIRDCGVDLALWIDISNKASYDRFLGRRWIQDKIVHISDEIAEQVNQLQMGSKASPQIYKNYEKLVQKNKLQEFFNEFGIQLDNDKNNKEIQVQQFREGQQQQSTTQQQQQNRLMKSWTNIDGHCPIQLLQRQVLAKFQQAMHFKNLKKQQLKLLNQQQQQQSSQRQQLELLQTQIKQKCVLSPPQLIDKKLIQAINSLQLDPLFVNQLCSIWETIEHTTINSLIQTFLFLNNQQKEQQNYFSSTKSNFINLLTREDRKFSIVKDFQINYNNFFDENKEMISHPYTKEELHQRVDDLEDALFDIIEMKRQDAIEERKSTNESGWVQSQLEQLYNSIRILIQAEINRYNASEKILTDFYSKKYSVSQLPYEQISTEIPYDSSLEMITKQGGFPRLQKLVTQAMRLFNREEQVVEDKNKKGGKVPAGKKEDKKGGKKGEVEEVKQLSGEQLQMRRGINIEKAIFRYRVQMIREFSVRRILSVTRANESLLKDLESYEQYTYEIENKCVFNLSKIFRSNIQREEKIQNQVEVNYVDIMENQMIRNFEKQKPSILPAREEPAKYRFAISRIWELIGFIQNESESQEKISTKRLLQLLSHLQNNHNEKQILPLTWKQLTPEQIETFVLKIDGQDYGVVELWKIFIFVIMSNFLVPSQQQLEQYFNELTSFGTMKQVSQEILIGTAAWFDQPYQEQQNVRTFKRNQQIKRILFCILKRRRNGQDDLQAEELISCLGLGWWKGPLSTNQSTATYFSAAFGL